MKNLFVVVNPELTKVVNADTAIIDEDIGLANMLLEVEILSTTGMIIDVAVFATNKLPSEYAHAGWVCMPLKNFLLSPFVDCSNISELDIPEYEDVVVHEMRNFEHLQEASALQMTA